MLGVGAGPVGESKLDALLNAGAAVTVVAPKATEAIRAAAKAGRVEWRIREFRPTDLAGVTLVVAAVPADIAKRVFIATRARGILCNSVDDPDNCDFYYPAVVNRGDLQIAISTGGRSPALAQRLRRELEEQFGPEYESWVNELGKAREELTA